MRAILIIIMGLPSLTFAGAVDSVKTYPAGGGGLSVLVYLKVLMLLALIIAFILFALWAVRRFAPQLSATGRTSAIKILGTSHLGPKKALFLVEVAGKVILLGVTDNNINHITEFTNVEEAENIRNHLAPSTSNQPFSQIFASMFNKKRGK